MKQNKKCIAEKLALAATALIGGVVHAQDTESEWDLLASVLTYVEPDRMSAAEVIVAGGKDYSDTSKFSFKVILDSLTGASANGAIEQNTPQTFTRPSGKNNFVTNANSTPHDDTFRDTRGQINLSWTDSQMKDTRYTIGTNLSKEFDYQSISFNGEIARDFNQKNSTLSAGLSFGSDQYNPHGKFLWHFHQWRFFTSDSSFIEPHFRFYQQSAEVTYQQLNLIKMIPIGLLVLN